jgi:hypothetical protein
VLAQPVSPAVGPLLYIGERRFRVAKSGSQPMSSPAEQTDKVDRAAQVDAAERRVTAFHEAGHAVVAMYLGRPVQRVTIQPNAIRLGLCEFKPGRGKAVKDWLEAEAIVMLGGLAAEARHTGQVCEEAALHDLRAVRALIAGRALGDRQADRLERRFLDKTDHILDQPGLWDAVTRIADELLLRTTISGRAAAHIYEDALSRVR